VPASRQLLESLSCLIMSYVSSLSHHTPRFLAERERVRERESARKFRLSSFCKIKINSKAKKIKKTATGCSYRDARYHAG
jgi:hypothetical protein